MTHSMSLENILIKTINRLITADFFNLWEYYTPETITKKMLGKYNCLKSFIVGTTKIEWMFKESQEIYSEDF